MSYNAVIKACAEAQDVARAEFWLSKMLAAGVEADIISYKAMFKACAGVRDAATAVCCDAAAGVWRDAATAGYAGSRANECVI